MANHPPTSRDANARPVNDNRSELGWAVPEKDQATLFKLN